MTSVPADQHSLPQSRRWWVLDPAGSLLGLAFAILSVTPSLLPRPTLLQGALAGIAFAIGYLLGTTVWAIARRLLWTNVEVPAFRRLWWIMYAIAWGISLVLLSTLSLNWQNEVRRLVEMPPLDGTNVVGFLVAFLPITALLIALGKAIIGIFHGLQGRIGIVPAGATTTFIVFVVIGGLVVGGVSVVDKVFYERNGLPAADMAAPTAQFRSAGAGSAVAWDTLGRHGAAFVGGGPTAAEISELTGQPAIEPIRVYAGLKSATTIEERADLVVAELERTGAFDRSVLVVATPTGSGWLEPQSVDSLEYLYGGDTAIASMQFAYTPSWVSFLFDPDAPVESARVLFHAIEDTWRTLPEDQRPLLLSYGLSLGAHGNQETFKDLDDVRAHTDGALFVGSPNSSRLWRTLQEQRDLGSPAWRPILDGGSEVRWISRPGDENLLPGAWTAPRVLYLQHATDPVTWLSPQLIYRKPAWLDPAQRSSDITPAMRWIPIVTALQVGIDMLGGEAVPAQFGHNFGDVVVTAWQQVIGDTGLSAEAIAQIQAEIETYAPIPSFEE